MALRLTIENEKQLPDGGPTSYALTVKGAVEIGRAQYLDWSLPDPNKIISNKHCEIRWKDGAYWLTDTSRNGTFLNGSDDRMQGAARLKDGDRITIGHYIVAVAIEEAEPPPRPNGLPKAVGLADIWGEEPGAPPIDPRLLRPREKVVRDADFLNRVADVARIAAPALPPVLPRTSPAASDDDWLPRREAPAAPPPAPAAMPPPPIEAPPLFEDQLTDSAWCPGTPARAAEGPPPPLPPPPASAAPRPAAPAPDTDILARLAAGLGLPAQALAGRDPGAFAEEVGRLLALVAARLKTLLDDRQQAKRTFRVAHHTTIAAFENNPLKFQPTAGHALAVMFGPPSENYLGAEASFEEAFKDLAEHQLLTLSAMQKAVQLLERELAPAAIEAALTGEKSFASMVGFSHGRFWDAYVHRWEDRTKYHGDGLSGAFMRDFAKCYDDLQKGS